MRARIATYALALAACATTQATPTWQRPGLESAVRPEMGPPQPGDAAPELELTREDGTGFLLSQLRGSWVLLHFTASWCPFCDAEVGQLGTIADAYAARNVKVVLVDVEEPHDHWREYADAHVAKSVIALWDGSGSQARKFAPPGAQPSFEDRAQAVFDASLVIDPAGQIRLFLLPNSQQFDPNFTALRRELDQMLSAPVAPAQQQVAAPSEPAELAPEQVVSFAVGPVVGSAGAHVDVPITLHIAAGYHTMSNTPSDPLYIATSVKLDDDPLVMCQEPRYPPARSFQLANATLSTFEGDVPIRIPCDIGASVPVGKHELGGTLEYQSCTATHCLFPTRRPVRMVVEVTP